jgi:anti-sigma28 factor (negative regulator of flagellin synthesis)
MNSDSNAPLQPKRKRSVTQYALQWVAERMRKFEEIKKQVDSGCYQVDSGKVAASLINDKGG